MFRTGYSIGAYDPNDDRVVLGPGDDFTKEKFIFVYQDVRGKFKSEGDFTVMQPHIAVKKSKKDVDESSDTYDTVEWLIKNIPNNIPKVGQWGISYPGWETAVGMIDAHPALVASSPQASPTDMWLGDDFHHNGAFRLMYTFGWLRGNARPRTEVMTGTQAQNVPFSYGTRDGYNFFMNVGPVSNIDKLYFHGQVPTWNEYMQHGDYDDYWKAQNVSQHMKNIRHSILNVAGWFDAEDYYGPTDIYYAIEKNNPKNKSTIIIGPWLHGGWSRMPGDSLGNIRFGSKTGEYFKKEVEFPFFVYHLKGKGNLNLPEALVFQTGKNEWRSFDAWPPKGLEARNLYFQANGKLSFTAPTGGEEAADSYVSDPNKPVPWSQDNATSQGHLWMVEDQRFAARRPDVLVWQTDPLTEDVTIAGHVVASLQVSMTGTDADFVTKLIDVYPGDAPNNVPNPQGIQMSDFQMLLAGEVFRGKYRNSFEKPEPFVPGRATKVEYELHDKLHTFLKGHRIMVQVQSTWFPVIDRNPQKFVDIYHASEADFQKSTITVHRSAQNPSHVKVSILR